MRSVFVAVPLLLAIGLMFQNCSPGFNAFELENPSGALTLSSESTTDLELSGLQNSPYQYNYAPSVIVENGNNYMWTCSNTASPGYFRDVISFYVNNKFENIALSHGEQKKDWDGEHACDPSVLRGNYIYDGQSYSYLMAYLGEDWNDANGNGKFEPHEFSMHNQVGVAFAKSINGPWIKYPRPLITYADRLTWGVGQPSLLKAPNGNILIFYTKGDPVRTNSYWQEFDFSNSTASTGPKLIRGETELTLRGLTSDSIIYIRNIDLVTDPDSGTVYMLRQSERDKNGYVQIATMGLQSLLSGNGTWSVLKNIDSSVTGVTNNHNAGFLRTSEGTLPNNSQLSVFVTTDPGTPTYPPQIEWDYHIIQVSMDIQKVTPIIDKKSCNEQARQSLTQSLACPAGQTGSLSQARNASCDTNTGSWNYSPWQTTANTCQTSPVPAIDEEPVTITSPANNSLTNANPTITWSYSGSATDFWMDISESADFKWFWNRKFSASTRYYSYSADGWGKVGSTPGNAPAQLEASKKYYLRIVPFKNGSAIAQSSSNIVTLVVQSHEPPPPVGSGILEILNPTFSAGQPVLSWNYNGSATDFWVDLSESSTFAWFWNKNFKNNIRSATYDGNNWGSLGSSPGAAPSRLVSGRTYYLRITPFSNGSSIAPESKILSFTAQ